MRARNEDVAVSLDIDLAQRPSSAGRHPPALELTLYRITQEALTNASRHAQATHIVVVITEDSSAITLTVSDDGAGFDPKAR